MIQDFIDSDNPKFEGKSKEGRRKMAIGAWYGMHPEQSNEGCKVPTDHPIHSKKTLKKLLKKISKNRLEESATEDIEHEHIRNELGKHGINVGAQHEKESSGGDGFEPSSITKGKTLVSVWSHEDDDKILDKAKAHLKELGYSDHIPIHASRRVGSAPSIARGSGVRWAGD